MVEDNKAQGQQKENRTVLVAINPTVSISTLVTMVSLQLKDKYTAVISDFKTRNYLLSTRNPR